MALLLHAERAAETVRFLREEYDIHASLTQTNDHAYPWTPYMSGPTVYLTPGDLARVPA